MKKGSLENKCSGIERKFNGVIQLKDVLPPLFYNGHGFVQDHSKVWLCT